MTYDLPSYKCFIYTAFVSQPTVTDAVIGALFEHSKLPVQTLAVRPSEGVN